MCLCLEAARMFSRFCVLWAGAYTVGRHSRGLPAPLEVPFNSSMLLRIGEQEQNAPLSKICLQFFFFIFFFFLEERENPVWPFSLFRWTRYSYLHGRKEWKGNYIRGNLLGALFSFILWDVCERNRKGRSTNNNNGNNSRSGRRRKKKEEEENVRRVIYINKS